jgi:hypothetical protein
MAASDPFAALPHALACHVFLLLSPHERARCALVCRGWCATLKDQSLWLRLDLTRADGVACCEATLCGAVARAGGQLQALRLAYCRRAVVRDGLNDALCAVLAANAGTLHELRVDIDKLGGADALRLTELEALLAAAPQLRVFHACAECTSTEETHRLLRSELPLAPLRLLLEVSMGDDVPADAALALAADVAACPFLTGLALFSVPLDSPGALDAVVDAALARLLSSVALNDCSLTPAAAPALARLAAGDSLTALDLSGDNLLLDEAAAVLLGDALRANTSLMAFRLTDAWLWRDAAAGAALVSSLTGHASLRELKLYFRHVPVAAAAAAGAALAALLMANAPALQTLNIFLCGLGDEGMGPVVEALRHNTHLTKLDCSGNATSQEFARDVLLPAVRANASLRELDARESERDVAAREAEVLVAERTRTQRQRERWAVAPSA